jgi:WD40 repeat protein
MTLSGHQGTVTCVKFDARGRLFSASDDGALLLWELSGPSGAAAPELSYPLVQQHHKHTKTTHRLTAFNGHGGPVWCLDFEDRLLASGSYDKTVKLWNVSNGMNLCTLRGHESWVSCVSVRGDALLSASWDATLRLWRLAPDRRGGQCVRTLGGEAGNAVHCLQMDWAAGRVATGGRHQALQVWDLEAGRVVETLMGHTKQVYCLQFDEAKLASGSGDHTVRVWDARSRRCELTLAGHVNSVMALQFDANFRLVSGGYDKTIRVWDLRTGRQLRTLFGHSSAVFSLQFDADKIVSGSADRSVKVWNFAAAPL